MADTDLEGTETTKQNKTYQVAIVILYRLTEQFRRFIELNVTALQSLLQVPYF